MTELPLAPTDIPRYRRIDVIGGVLVCAIAVAIWLDSMGLAVGELSYFGPGFMPRILATVLLVCGLALLVFGLTQPPSAAEGLVFAMRGPIAIGLAILLFALTIRGIWLGPVRIPQFGILLTGPLTVIVAGLGGARARVRELIVLGIGLTAASVLVFADALNMQLPVFPAVIEHMMPVAWGLDWPRRIAVLAYAVLGYGLWRAFGLSFADLKDDNEEEPGQ
jgi:putative tricarboxylic transport membrane protein